MKRREFITLVAGAAASWPFAGSAQQGERVRRIGVVIGSSTPENDLRIARFEERLRTLGWIKGDTVEIEYRSSDGNPARIKSNVQDIIALAPDVILAQSTSVVVALHRATQTIPIIFVHVSDPIGSGLVASFAKPGGNITGFTDIEASLAGKWVQLLREADPSIQRVALLFNPETAPGRGSFFLQPFEHSARLLGLSIVPALVHNTSTIETAMANLATGQGGGLVITPEAFAATHSAEIIALAQGFRLPTVYPYRYYTTRGGLLSYGIHPTDLFRRAAEYVDRVLGGSMPAELPVQAPTTFELVINLKTAKAMGLTIPPLLLARADEVIE